MNRKNSRLQKKLAILPIVLVAMLLTTGAAYAFWYDTLTISGDVTTSDFDVDWSLTTYGDNEPDGKDTVLLTDSCFVMEQDWNTVTVTIDGAYPCYEFWFRIGVVCAGQVPAHLKDSVVIDAPAELEITLTDENGGPAFPDNEFGQPWQLHFGYEYFLLIKVHVFEDDNAVPPILPHQGQTYTFTITIPLIQYNYN
jgi:predicted ribosomally synthesized peptide with SipW-like signal peptide